MGFRYRAANANCNNDVLGRNAVTAIMGTIQNEKLDFFVINCQELDFKEAISELERNLPDNYKIIRSDLMTTHTKYYTQGNKNYGMATLIIYNYKTVDPFHKKGSSKIIRRVNNRLTGSSYNKGGVISDFEIKERDKPLYSIQLQTISAHLESGAARNRSVDWRNINKGLAKDVLEWDDLVNALPTLRIAGYDANTRNQILANNEVVNPWKQPANNAETQGLYQLPLGVSVFTADNTYKTYDKSTIETKSSRKGYAKAGSLDFCTVSSDQNVDPSINFINDTQSNDYSGFHVPVEDSTTRDHAIVISPIQKISINNDLEAKFQSCKAQIANALTVAAPTLAKEIWELSPNHEKKSDDSQLAADKKQLMAAYQLFLSPEGLIQQSLNLQIHRLKIFDTLKNSPVLAGPEDKKLVENAIFKAEPWFKDVTLTNMSEAQAQFNVKNEATALVLRSLKDCVNAQSMLSRLAVLNEPIKESTVENYLLTQYTKRLNDFKANLDNLADSDMKTCGSRILDEIKKEFNTMPTSKPPSNIQLIQLIELMDNCIAIQTTIQSELGNKQELLQKSCGQLALLSQNVPGKSYQQVERIAKALLIFACVALVVGGLLAAIPSGGSSLLLTVAGVAGLSAGGLKIAGGVAAGVAALSVATTDYVAKAKSQNTEGLRHSILEYKKAVNQIKLDGNKEDENESSMQNK